MATDTITVPCGKLQQFIDVVTVLNATAQEVAAVPEVSSVPEVRLDYGQVKRAITLGLGFIDPTKPYGTELFDALCRLTVTPAYEAVCLREAAGRIEVLLTRRSATESAAPGEWHCPGTCPRASTNEAGDFARLGKNEFGAEITSRHLVDQVDAPDVKRGNHTARHISLVFLCEVPEGSQGTWYPVDQLPEPMVPIHRDEIIPMAVKAYERELKLKRG